MTVGRVGGGGVRLGGLEDACWWWFEVVVV